jgi:hypothetical protein
MSSTAAAALITSETSNNTHVNGLVFTGTFVACFGAATASGVIVTTWFVVPHAQVDMQL